MDVFGIKISYELTDPSAPSMSFLSSLCALSPKPNPHPVAQYYKLNFGQLKKELAYRLYKGFNRAVFNNQLPSDMPILWTDDWRIARQVIHTSYGFFHLAEIKLFTLSVNRADILCATLIHQMCHAAVWILDQIDEFRYPHSVFWRRWAVLAKEKFPELPVFMQLAPIKLIYKYVFRCNQCNFCIGYHNKRGRILESKCPTCGGSGELLKT